MLGKNKTPAACVCVCVEQHDTASAAADQVKCRSAPPPSLPVAAQRGGTRDDGKAPERGAPSVTAGPESRRRAAERTTGCPPSCLPIYVYACMTGTQQTYNRKILHHVTYYKN